MFSKEGKLVRVNATHDGQSVECFCTIKVNDDLYVENCTKQDGTRIAHKWKLLREELLELPTDVEPGVYRYRDVLDLD